MKTFPSFSIFHFLFCILFTLTLLFLPDQAVHAQLLDTMGAVSVGAEMQGQSAAAGRQVGGRVGEMIEAKNQKDAETMQLAQPDGGSQHTGGNSDDGNSSAASDESQGSASGSSSSDSSKRSGNSILEQGWWGPGGYVSPTKLGLNILVFFIWVFCASWMNSDMERLGNANREACNLGYVVLYLILGLGLLFLPFFIVAFPLTLLGVVVPSIIYVVQRNSTLPPHEKVLTGEHLFFVFATTMNKLGMKIKVKPRMSYESGSPIQLEAGGKNIDANVLKGRLILARNAPGYNDLREHLYDAIASGATSMMFDFTPDRTAMRHQVDGVWLDLEPVPRVIEKGKTKDVMEEVLEAAKMIVGANPADRRSRQGGSFVAVVRKKNRYDIDFLSQGTQTGEAAMFQFTAKKVPFQSLESLGMRPEIKDKILANLNAKKGIFIISAPPANGLRSSMDVFSRNCDRFTRDVVNVEDVMQASENIENVVEGKYDSSKGETPMTVLPDIIFKEPGALIVRDMSALPTLEFCCKEVDNDRLFITMTRAKDVTEAILKYLATKIPPQTFIARLNGVVCQRLIRKLCSDCKEPYQPAPQLLQQLRLRPDQVREFYRQRTPLPEPEEKKRGICPTCGGIGYHGRTALFELIEMNDTIREVILSNPNPVALRQQLANQCQTSFLYEGIHLLLKGETTVEEFSRIMKL